jgi:putative phosphoesterase
VGEEGIDLVIDRVIGVISDTHGLLRPEALDVLRGVDAIIHAGDIGGMEIIRALERIAPVTFVEGNNDEPCSGGLQPAGTDIVRARLGGLRVLVTHILPHPHALDRRVVASLGDQPADLVVFGHSHLPHDETIDGVRFFNPASAGPRRFDYPVAVGIIDSRGARHVALDARSREALRRRMNQLSKR